MASKSPESFGDLMMKMVIAGKGGREHALAKKLQDSAVVMDLFNCPGNAGMARLGFECVPAETADEIEKFCLENKIEVVVVGPEALILSDLKARLEKHGIFCFAPSAAAGRLESSKLFCKEILTAAGVPTAEYSVNKDLNQALAAVALHDFISPLVVKADGLAAGKGVWVCENRNKAEEAVRVLGATYGFPLLFEECLVGQELSAFALCDGEDFVLLGTAVDYKRITPDPFSANTGGMGAYSPCDFISEDDKTAIHHIFSATLKTLKGQGLPYQGFLFAGLMKTNTGLVVIEYNVRMGDPETQSLLPRIQSDLGQLIVAACKHELKNQTCEFTNQTAVHVVAVSEGYPEAQMNLGHAIVYSEMPRAMTLYFSGVLESGVKLLNSGGRVLGVTALADNKEQARQMAYEGLSKISFTGMYFREDIAK
jgi:phosphoribosylamine--glycine ligase